jgi:hypothetical protein
VRKRREVVNGVRQGASKHLEHAHVIGDVTLVVDADDVVTALAQVGEEVSTDESVRSGDERLHDKPAAMS